jgi:hypothetical protein
VVHGLLFGFLLLDLAGQLALRLRKGLGDVRTLSDGHQRIEPGRVVRNVMRYSLPPRSCRASSTETSVGSQLARWGPSADNFSSTWGFLGDETLADANYLLGKYISIPDIRLAPRA